MDYFPIFLDARHINALVVGGGDVAARKIELLLKSTSQITVVSQHISASVERLIKVNHLTFFQHNYQAGMLKDINLVIAATDDKTVNKAVADEAKSLNILTNVVDQPELCTYITPAIIDRNPIIVALSSSGTAPILLRMLRKQVDRLLPSNYGKLADFSFKFKQHVKARVKGARNRRTFWENTLKGQIGENILQGKVRQAEQQLISSIKQLIPPPVGEIVFIHTVSGDPEKITVQAYREMQSADAVFYDEAVNIDLIDYIRRDADKYPQEIASSILINFQHALDLAEQGQKVIYLLAGHHSLPENSALTLSNIQHKQLISGV